jgi:xylulose-5-phosphate/fructose-6-phosphate phosphoketolase
MKPTIDAIKQYVRATNYLSAIQIYLQDNVLLERPLSFDDIKPRLLGHWGTCPGINFTYAHLNALIARRTTSGIMCRKPRLKPVRFS